MIKVRVCTDGTCLGLVSLDRSCKTMWKYREELAEEIRLGSLSTRLEQGLGTPPLTTSRRTATRPPQPAKSPSSAECTLHECSK